MEQFLEGTRKADAVFSWLLSVRQFHLTQRDLGLVPRQVARYKRLTSKTDHDRPHVGV